MRETRRLTCGLLCVVGAFGSAQSTRAAAPYPPSKAITRVTFDWPTHIRRANGSDNWPITWADDNHQYAAWGDGQGFGESGAKQSLGVSRIAGTADNQAGTDLWGLPVVGTAGGKSYGIIAIDGVLYMWVGPGSNTTSYDEARLHRSTTHGTSWTVADWAFVKAQRLVMPTILNFGKDYAGARDDFVYHYFIRLEGNPGRLDVHKPGRIDLARVPKDQLMSRPAYAFFAGLGANGQARWTSDAAQRQPVFEDPDGVGWNVSVRFNPGLGRYLLCTEHGQSLKGRLGIFDAPTPWGPWTTVLYTDRFGADHIETSTFFWNFSNKWLSADGRDFVLVFTGVNSNDSWNTVEGMFTYAPNHAASTSIIDINFDWSTHVQRAPGSDNWPITWADDDHQYTAWGDGGGFGGTNEAGRVSNGFARLEGNKRDYVGCNIAGGVRSPGGCPSPTSAPFTGKCHGLVSIGGTLYAWRDGDGSSESAYAFTELWKSTDHAATWSFTGVRFRPSDFDPPADRGFFCTHFLQFGKDYTSVPAHLDGFFYLYATNVKRSDWRVQSPGEITLMRVPTGQVESRSAYQYFAGTDGDGKPVWTASRSARRPVWRDPRNGVHRITASYNAPLGRYFLWTEHTARNSGNTAIYEAPEPWGPWRTVLFDTDFASEVTRSKGVIFLSFADKWLSPDGLDFVAVMSIDDAFDTVEGRFRAVQSPLPQRATQPAPADGAIGVSPRPELTWTAGEDTTSYEVYFRTVNPPGPGEFQDSPSGTRFFPGRLALGTTYYWRIDAVNAGGVTPGEVWRFTTTAGDFDGDGDTDLGDFGTLQTCFTGKGGIAAQECTESDLDVDADVDGSDLALWLGCMNGADVPPGC